MRSGAGGPTFLSSRRGPGIGALAPPPGWSRSASSRVVVSSSADSSASTSSTGGPAGSPREPREPRQERDPDILTKFKEGFKRFKTNMLSLDPGYFATLDAIQVPKVLVIGCCDSRVSPTSLMSADPADIYSIRNVANLVPPYDPSGGQHGTSAALEYAVCVLDVQHIIVLGHTDCGGIRALMNLEDVRTYHTDGDFIGQWVSGDRGARPSSWGF